MVNLPEAGARIKIPMEPVIAVFQEGLRQGIILGFECDDCHWHQVSAMGASCLQCGSPNLRWKLLSGRGTLRQATVMYRQTRIKQPTVRGIVEMEEGGSLVSALILIPEFNFDQPHKVKDYWGKTVKASIYESGEQRILAFQPI
jgi:uncharacterized OB-fold protein